MIGQIYKNGEWISVKYKQAGELTDIADEQGCAQARNCHGERLIKIEGEWTLI